MKVKIFAVWNDVLFTQKYQRFDFNSFWWFEKLLNQQLVSKQCNHTWYLIFSYEIIIWEKKCSELTGVRNYPDRPYVFQIQEGCGCLSYVEKLWYNLTIIYILKIKPFNELCVLMNTFHFILLSMISYTHKETFNSHHLLINRLFRESYKISVHSIITQINLFWEYTHFIVLNTKRGKC